MSELLLAAVICVNKVVRGIVMSLCLLVMSGHREQIIRYRIFKIPRYRPEQLPET